MPAPELAAMRARIQSELAGERPDRYHPKLGFGGLVDVEFLAQWLQMAEGAKAQTDDRRTAPEAPSPDARSAPDAQSTLDALHALAAGGRLARGPGTRSAEQVARRLGIRERDGHEPAQVLDAQYRRTTEEIRAIFERVIAPVAAPAPWSSA
jgi:glutamine synthetase adenylyltransferase